ncbi:hypothetical protein PENTCL1PPCAC_23486, partial [Pristionchus entomophagus]
MKLALLISVLITSCVDGNVYIPMKIHGSLSCSTPFHYNIRLWGSRIFVELLRLLPARHHADALLECLQT